MQLVEHHVIKRTEPRFAVIDQASFAAKNLYNAANYLMRQAFIFQGERILDINTLYHQAKHLDAYKGLPRKVSTMCCECYKGIGKPFTRPRRHGSTTRRSSWANPAFLIT